MMTGRTFWLYTTVTLAGGVAGGALMIQLATGVAMAAKPAARTLTAQRLVLTDLDGRKHKGVTRYTIWFRRRLCRL